MSATQHDEVPIEQRPLLVGTGQRMGPYMRRFAPAERTMLHVLERQARERPGHPWLVFDSVDTLTFADAQRLVDRVADSVGRTVEPGGHVALFLENQIEFMPAFLGAMAAGCVAVPINAESRGPLLEYVVANSQVTTLIARTDLLDRLVALDGLGDVRLVVACGDGDVPERIHGATVVSWETFLEESPEAPPAPRALPSAWDTAVIQFTSGTTGNSKGVVCSHHYMYLYSAAVCDSQRRTADDVLTTPLPLFHVAALHMIADAALHAGCTAHLKSRFSASAFWPQAAADGATFSIFLGPMAEIILKNVPTAPEHRVRELFCVPFPPNGRAFEERFGVRLLWQGYGMTEVYPLPMPLELEPDVPFDTIGVPAEWVEYGVVDEDDLMVAPGEIGEIVFRPRLPHVMAEGYFNAPEATAAAFRGCMFHTGDLGYYDTEGRLHFGGRRQDRIRRRGENVSAVELEFVVVSHPHVVEAAAYGVPGEFGEHEVKVDIVALDEIDVAELHGWLVEQLPRFMVPRYIERLPELPKTASQKVQKYRLAEASVDRPAVHVFEPVRR